MTTKKAACGVSEVKTLAAVLAAIRADPALAGTRCRDLASSVNRVAELLGASPEQIATDDPALRARLAALNAASAGVARKTLQTLRSNFSTALQISGARRRRSTDLTNSWKALIDLLTCERHHILIDRKSTRLNSSHRL